MKKSRKFKVLLLVTIVFLMLLPCSTVFAAGKPSFSEKSVNLAIGKTYDLKVVNVMKNATGTFKSSNTTVATVSNKGQIKGIAEGTAKINLKLKTGGKKYTLTINVTVFSGATAVTIQNKMEKLAVGQTLDLKYSMAPEATKDKVTWISDHPSIVSIDVNGKMSALQPGEAQIKAVTYSCVEDSFTVIVTDDKTKVYTSKDIDKTINYLDVTNQTLENVYLSNSISNIPVKFSGCTINGTLTIETGMESCIEVVATKVDTIRIVKPGAVQEPNSDTPRTSLIIRKDTVVKNAILEAGCYFDTAEANGTVSLTIAPQAAGDYDIGLRGYQGDFNVDYTCKATTRIELISSKIGTANINNASGDYCLLTSNDEEPSTVDTINQKTSASCYYDVKTNLVNLDPSVKKADIMIASTVNKLVHYGADIKFQVAEDALLSEVIDKKDASGKYGNYSFYSGKLGNIAFSVQSGKKKLEGVCLKDFVKIFSIWKDTSKPFSPPEDKSFVLTCIAKNTYLIDDNGDKITLGYYPDQQCIKLYGNENIILSNIMIIK